MAVHRVCAAPLLLFLTVASSPAQTAVTARDAALGAQLAEEFRRHSAPIDSPSAQEYLDRLGKELAARIPDARFPFTFSLVVDDPCTATHEPAWLPGGHVFVSSGLFLAAMDEDVLAGMLAHAMEHIARRHNMRQLEQGTGVNDERVPIAFVGGFRGMCSASIPTVTSRPPLTLGGTRRPPSTSTMAPIQW